MKPVLEINKVFLKYSNKNGNRLKALNDINMHIFEGEKICVLGPSGCGKSSLLSLISGLKKVSGGEILHRGNLVTSPSSERVIIFQNYALYPWKTALENIEFVLRIKHKNNNVKKEAKSFLKLVNLEKFADSYPHELSGGMQQRIGIARALSCNPDILLFDEPFASLDQITKNILYDEIQTISKKFNKTMIFVTHSIEEALYLGDRVFVMSSSPGRVVGEFKVDFEKPENVLDLKHDPHFIKMETEIFGLLNSYLPLT